MLVCEGRGGQCEGGDIVQIWKALLRMKPMKEVSQPMGVKYHTTVEITVAEFPETTVIHKKMSAPEVGRHNLQTVKVRNPSIRPRGGQKHICKCS